MGIIIRQSIKHSLVNFFGTAIGAISILFIYPYNDELYGFAQWFYNTSFVLVPFASLGVLSLVVKFYPNYEKAKKTTGFTSLIGVLLLTAFSIFITLFLIFETQFIQFLDFILDASKIADFKWLLLPLTGLLCLETWLRFQSANQKRIVIPSIITQLGYKIFLPSLILISVIYNINNEQAGMSIVGFFLFAVIALFLYLRRINGFNLGKPVLPKQVDLDKKSVASYGLFGSLNSIGNSLSFRIDSVMIPLIIDFGSNGIYNKILFISNVIGIPSNSIASIASPIISEAFEKNDMAKVSDIYRRSSANLFLVGSFLFLLIWFNLSSIISLSVDPTTFPNAAKILLFLGAAKIIDMITSLNNQILIYSKKYKYNLLFLLLLGTINVYLNYKWISDPQYGIVGAAMATFTSMLIYNTFKYLFIWHQFKMQPLSLETIKILIVAMVSFGILWIIPSFSNPFIHIILYSGILCLVYFASIYLMQITKDSHELLHNFTDKLLKRNNGI